MKILLTGANGLLGQKIIRLAPEFGVTLIPTGKGPYRGQPQNLPGYRELDITSEEAVNQTIRELQPDAVIHAAAMTQVDDCETKREEATLANATATGNIAKACAANGVHLIHVSTDFIFDGKEGPYAEDAAAHPLSHYGETKLKAEELVKQHASSWAILRTVLVYGVTPGLSRSNIVLWAFNALKEGKTITVVTDQFRSPTLAEDLAQGCLLAATKNAKGIYHISGPDQMSIYELVQRVARFFGFKEELIKPITSDTLNQPAKRPPVTGFIIEKAKKELGYLPHDFEAGLALVKQQMEE